MLILKAIHVSAAAVSISGFVVRGIWMLRGSPLLRARWVRIAPHVVDTILLASAIALAWQLRLSPIRHDWLMAKLLALLVYIGLGMLALRFGRTRRQRFLAWIAAIAVFAYIAGAAITRSPVLSIF